MTTTDLKKHSFQEIRERFAGLPTGLTRRQPVNATHRFLKAVYQSLFGLAVGALLTGSVDAQNVSVTDYSVPVSRVDNLRIDGFSFSVLTEGDEILDERANVGVAWKKLYSSLPYAYSFDFSGTASYNREPSGNRTGTFAGDLDIQVQKYFKDTNKFFYSLSPDFLFRKEFDRPQADITLGLGYGRFIDATALRKAVRIEDFLMKEGVISDHMPKNTMIELGHIIEKEKEYRDLYGDRSYQNYWYEDMSNEIYKTNLVLGDLGPIGILRMREVLTQEQINDRFFGWDISAGVQYRLLTEFEGLKRPSPSMALNFRYSRPVNWNTQINTTTKIDSPFNDSFGREYTVAQRIDFIYEITNKIAFTALNTFRVDKKRLLDAKFSTASTVGFNFFIENKINLSIFEQISKTEGAPFRQSLTFALSYRIL